MATCYFKDLAASGYAWTTVANWWTDAACTVAKGSLPIAGETIYIAGQMDSGLAAPIAFAHIYVADATTGGGFFSVDFTNATGPATFDQSSFNIGVVTGACTFNGGSKNIGVVNGNCTFNDGSYNSIAAIIEGACTFNSGSYNLGVVNGNCTFNESTNNGSTITGACTFNGSSGNNGGTIFGSAEFNIGSYNTGFFISFSIGSYGVLKNVGEITTPDGGTTFLMAFTVDYPRTDILGTGLL